MARAMYPGSFDPVTLGHLDIVARAAALFDQIVVAVYGTPAKDLMFPVEERVRLFREAASHIPNVEVVPFTGLAVEAARNFGCKALIRGLRMGSDFEYEFEMTLMNKRLAPDIEVVCFMTSLEYQFISSSLLKEVAQLGGDVEGLVPPNVAEALRERLGLTAEVGSRRKGASSRS
ncbi:MAG: pantetheine-phosphate adenylyltransferase [Dehalococcoidia bacterium]